LTGYRWHKTDESINLAHCPNHEQQFLYYARFYTIGQNFKYSESNQLILNLKISKSEVQRNPQRKPHKQRAINQFAKEVTALLKQVESGDPLFLIPIPPSKMPSDPEYDDRMELVAKRITDELENVQYFPVLSMSQSMESYHSGSDARNPEQLFQMLKLDENLLSKYDGHSIIALIDDVLTSGAHFTAATRRLEGCFTNVQVIGIFWAKAVPPPEEYSEV
jgi:hypothetical protein